MMLVAANLLIGCGMAAPAFLTATSRPAATGVPTSPAIATQAAAGAATSSPEATAQAGQVAVARVPILMYHHIADDSRWPNDARKQRLAVQPEQFAEQLDYLQQAGYTTITLDDLVSALYHTAPLPAKPVILTFDDGYQDFYSTAYPLLKRYSDKATIYIISEWVGKPDIMTWDELRELASSPLITIGAHTRTHPKLADHSAERIHTEIAGGKADLESQLHTTVRHLAYPYGSYNAATLEQARLVGFVTATTVHYGVEERADKLLELPRVFVNGGTPLEDLIVGLEGRR